MNYSFGRAESGQTSESNIDCSLFVDGVTVVLYNVMRALSGLEVVTGLDVFLGVLSFFSVALGGMVIGIVVGGLSAFVLRFTSHVKCKLTNVIVLLQMRNLIS